MTAANEARGDMSSGVDESLLVLDSTFCVTRTDERLWTLLGIQRRGALGRDLGELLALDADALGRLHLAAREFGQWSGEVEAIGGSSPLHLSVRRFAGSGDDAFGVVLSRPRETAIAGRDPLTGMLTRRAFQERLPEAVSGRLAQGGALALLMVDLHRFGFINEVYGERAGDGILREVGRRLEALLAPGDLLARMGSDQFAILQADPERRLLAQEVLDAVSRPLTLRGRSITPSASVGVAFCPGDARSADALARRAALALREARAAGGQRFQFYRTGMDRDVTLQCALEYDLPRAIRDSELLLHYQPQVDLGSGSVCGCEALVRWRHPEHGLLPPGRFIPVAEANGAIIGLGEWVLQRACEQVVTWRAIGQGPARIAVNVSARQLRDRFFPQRLEGILARTGATPDCLEIEVTESVAHQNPEQVRHTLGQLQDMGVDLAIDDFGAGFSSLFSLQFIPARTLKLDRALTANAPRPHRQIEILRAAVELGHRLDMRVLAEGIETAGQVARLREMGCELGQGHLLGRPVSPMEICAQARDVAPPVDWSHATPMQALAPAAASRRS